MSVAGRGMRLAELLGGVAGTLPELRISGLTQDSRKVKPGDAFVALRGATQHGIAHARTALDAGAAVVLYEPPVAPELVPAGALAVPGLRARLGALAARYFGDASAAMTVIGVTGTNGKTSTVQLLAQALAQAGHSVGTIGTLGAGLHGALEMGERTTPDVITTHALVAAMRARGATHLAMEVSSHALEQGRVDGIAYDLAVFTNLTRDHLDYHGSMEAYGAAKARLFAWPGLSAAVVNIDDAFGRELLARLPETVAACAYSAAGSAQAKVRARDVRSSAAGVAFELQTPWGDAPVQSMLLGAFNVSNLLAVAGCLGQLGWSGGDIAAALARLTPIAGRMNRLGGDAAMPLVVIDYAHTPDALEQTLGSLRPHTSGRLICVFGCGGDRDAGKRPQMGAIAARRADLSIVTDDNPRSEDGDAIVAQIVAGFDAGARYTVERDRARAIRLAVELARPGDTVLVAGKGHEAWQEVGARKLPFDDAEHARAALGLAA